MLSWEINWNIILIDIRIIVFNKLEDGPESFLEYNDLSFVATKHHQTNVSIY